MLQVLFKSRYLSTKLYGVTFQKPVVFNVSLIYGALNFKDKIDTDTEFTDSVSNNISRTNFSMELVTYLVSSLSRLHDHTQAHHTR